MRAIHSNMRVLSEGEVLRVHAYSLRILENIGIHTPNDDMLALLKGAGCIVDNQTQIAKYPRVMIEKMLNAIRARKEVPEHNEMEKQYGNISTQTFLIDYLKRERRYGTMDDIKKGIALTDCLQNFPSPDAIVVPSDVPSHLSDLYTYQTMYTYSKKPGGTYITNIASAEPIIQMSKYLGRKVGFSLDTVSPLKIHKESLETAMIFARHGMPLTFCSTASTMSAAPVTAAGAIVMQNAEYLAGIVMLHCLGERCNSYPGMVYSIDPSTLVCSFGSPFIARTSIACAQMARFYGLIPSGNVALTDSLMPDFQAGFEKAFSMMIGMSTGVKGIGCQGIAGGDQGNSFEQLVIDNEWLDAYNHFTQGVVVTDESIGYAAIEEISRSGSYPAMDHMQKHFDKELWRSSLFVREPWDMNVGPGCKDLLERAHDRVEEYTAGYRQMEPVISEAQLETIHEIVREAEKKAEK